TPPEGEVAAIDAQIRAVDVGDRRDDAVTPNRDEVAAEIRPDGGEAGNLAAAIKVGQLSIEGQVGEAVGIISQKHLVVDQMPLDRFEALADVGRGAGVDEGNPPIVDVAVQELELPAAAGQHEIV